MKRSSLFLSLCTLIGFILTACQTQAPEGGLESSIAVCPYHLSPATWSTQLQGSSQLDLALAVETDLSVCAIYAGGETSASLAGQPFAGGNDVYLTRYNTLGGVVWTRELGTFNWDKITDIAVDSDTVGTVRKGCHTEA